MAGIQGFLGKPHSSRHISLDQMYEMREDAMLSFAQLMGMVPILTSKWSMESSDARSAAFMDNALRRVYGRLTLQFFIAKQFGFQALVKEFGQLKPGWQYLDKESQALKPVWDEGDIPALVWEPFIPLRPESVQPNWRDGDGSFNGIKLNATGFSLPGLMIYNEMVAGTEVKREAVDLAHSLWVVNQRDEVFGSIWGRSQFRSAFEYWWAGKLALTILNRSVERKGDPAVVVRYPAGSTTYMGQERSNQEIAFEIGRLARSGSVLAIPSEAHDEDDGGKSVPKWNVEYLTSDEKFERLESILGYLDTQKFRSMLIPEQAAFEGKGGTSSRNVAKELGTRSAEMQIAVQTEHDAIINQYMIPQLLEAHRPILSDAPVRKVTKTFGEDEALLGQTLIESMANKNPEQLPVDWRGLLERYNVETLSIKEVEAEKERLAAEAAVAKPPPQEAKPGSNGKAGVTDTGFYYDAKELITLAEDENFLAALPRSKHYEDRAVLAQARLIRKLWHDLLTAQYENFATYVESGDVELDAVELAADDSKRRQKIVDAIMAGWSFASDSYSQTVKRTAEALQAIFSRAGKHELKRASIVLDDWDPEEKDLVKWVKDNAASMVRRVEDTTHTQLRTFLLAQVKEDRNAPQIAMGIREHFAQFPAWRADLIASNEVRNFYNASTLFAARAAGHDQVQALDARLGPERSDLECIKRNGQLFSIDEAFKENAKEHPRGTLAWRILPVKTNLTIERVSVDDDYAARIDREAGKIFLQEGLDLEQEGSYLLQLGEWLERTAPLAVA